MRQVERLCICAQHNPTPPLASPVGQRRLGALERAGARDLVSLEQARENITWLSARMCEAIGRVIQARMAGSWARGYDICVINQARSVLLRILPHMEGIKGAYSLDGLPVPYHHLALPSSPLWDGWTADADAAADEARHSVHEVKSRVTRILDARRQAQEELLQEGLPQEIHAQQGFHPPLVVDGSTPYGHQPTTQVSMPDSTSYELEPRPWYVDHEDAELLIDQQRQRIQRLPMMSPWVAHTTEPRTAAASTSASRPYEPDHLHQQQPATDDGRYALFPEPTRPTRPTDAHIYAQNRLHRLITQPQSRQPPSPSTDTSIDDILAAISRPRPAESDDDSQILPLRPKRSYRDAVVAPTTTTKAAMRADDYVDPVRMADTRMPSPPL